MEMRQGASQTDTLGLLIPVLAATFVFLFFVFEGNCKCCMSTRTAAAKKPRNESMQFNLRSLSLGSWGGGGDK